MGQVVTGPFYVRHGIVAGCPSATAMIRIFIIGPLGSAGITDSVSPDVHIDDHGLSTVRTCSEVVYDMSEAATFLHAAIVDDLGGSFCHEKANLVSSHLHVAVALRKKAGLWLASASLLLQPTLGSTALLDGPVGPLGVPRFSSFACSR
eukprot:8898515-Pyramimonas_sp.AAC.1